jgi:iron complex transport system permease protein
MRLPALPVTIAAALLLAGALFLAVFIGEVPLPASTVVRALLGALPADDLARTILIEDRLPRALLAALVGAALAVSGAALQGLTGNPLADPFLVGTASGASVGAGLAILLGLTGAMGGLALPLLAFAGALVATGLVFALARSNGQLLLSGFLLAGVVVGTFLAALMNLLLALAGQEQSRVLAWLLGYFGNARWQEIALLAPVVLLGTIGLARAGRGLDALTFGEATARSVGIEVEPFKRGVLATAALLTATAVAFSGVIGFVGLVVPHLVRALIGPPHRTLLPASALLGGTVLTLADLLSRVLRPGQPLPVGVVTALLGAPFFLLLLRRRGGE